MTKAVLGIDPGATGAAMFIDLETGILTPYDAPGGKVIPAHAMSHWLYETAAAYDPKGVQVGIEMTPSGWTPRKKEGEEPKTPRSSTALTGLARNAGVWEGIVASQGYAYRYVSPGTWKAHFGLRGKDKADALIVAQREFPAAIGLFGRKKDIGRAEAALIGLYVARNLRMGA
jgi:hypothetical protein